MEIRFTDGFLPLQGQVFEVIDVSGSVSGSFAHVIFPDLRSGFQFSTQFVNGHYQITALSDGAPAAGLLNISTRGEVGVDDDALIAGFIVIRDDGQTGPHPRPRTFPRRRRNFTIRSPRRSHSRAARRNRRVDHFE